MSVFLVMKDGYNGGSHITVGVFDNHQKAFAAVEKELNKQDGWREGRNKDEWHNGDYEWTMTIEEVEVQ